MKEWPLTQQSVGDDDEKLTQDGLKTNTLLCFCLFNLAVGKSKAGDGSSASRYLIFTIHANNHDPNHRRRIHHDDRDRDDTVPSQVPQMYCRGWGP